MANRRPPKTNDLIRWFVDAGLRPRVQIGVDGSVTIEAMSEQRPLSSSTKRNEIAETIRRIGRSANGQSIGES
jgi:hypothetical protein